ncbi:uncharacterized protein N7459_005241 [Penicillium hispanicum]|uniref:uncharacterized protein n=1 Tax=Penicillium hispanicum TaxID=1080232 RepID=UPI00254124C0|nr:uncharacterized protein N7459_005241 [Penicillium hispanicum]KAJ5585441.1 hypothetical protein N7459_005241 [Penicillium hispanicum]
MQYASIVAITTTLLAVQAPAQFIPRPYGMGPYMAPAMASPIPAVMESSMAPVASSSMAPMASSSTAPSEAPNWIAHWSMMPHSLATPTFSPSHSWPPSATPSSTPSSPFSYGLNRRARPFHPNRPSDPGSAPSSNGFHEQEGNRGVGGYPSPADESPASEYNAPADAANAPVPNGGSIAPVDSMQPGSNVAPVQIEKPHGQDEGNSFCAGSCYASEKEAECAQPYVSCFPN